MQAIDKGKKAIWALVMVGFISAITQVLSAWALRQWSSEMTPENFMMNASAERQSQWNQSATGFPDSMFNDYRREAKPIKHKREVLSLVAFIGIPLFWAFVSSLFTKKRFIGSALITCWAQPVVYFLLFFPFALMGGLVGIVSVVGIGLIAGIVYGVVGGSLAWAVMRIYQKKQR